MVEYKEMTVSRLFFGLWGELKMNSMNSWNATNDRNVVEGLRSSVSQGKFMVRVYSLLAVTLLVRKWGSAE
jgi:hypothetical protein